MSNDIVLGRFQLDLPENIIKDISTPNKLFSSEFLSADSSTEVAPSQKGKRGGIQLEKISDAHVRISFTVFGLEPESVDNSQLTDPTSSLSTSTQVPRTTLMNNGVQTLIDMDDECSQTDPTPVTHQPSQTEVSVESAGCQATVGATDMPAQTLTSMALQQHQQCQAAAELSCADVQAVVEVSHYDAQTECVQTEVTVQTDNPVLHQTPSQTDASMALQAEQECQAVTTMVDSVSQAVALSGHQLCQTNSSMALEFDACTQAAPDTSSTDSQAQADTDECHVQTDVNTYEQNSQTDSADISQPDSQADSVPDGPTAPQSEVTNNGLCGEAPIHPMEPIPGEEAIAVPMKMCSFEAESQTDPVTIIIGDASFLVKKLKSSAASPSKVRSRGNEIEIEVKAESSPFGGRQSTGGAYGSPAGRPKQGGARVRMPVQRSPGMRGGSTRGAYSPRVPNSPQFATPRSAPPSSMGGSTPSGASGRRYNCPFCVLMFEESPALYEHIQNDHDEQRALLKQPKGREGKTIQMKPPEPEPPVLTPMVDISTEQEEVPEEQISQEQQLVNMMAPKDVEQLVVTEQGIQSQVVQGQVVQSQVVQGQVVQGQVLDNQVVSDQVVQGQVVQGQVVQQQQPQVLQGHVVGEPLVQGQVVSDQVVLAPAQYEVHQVEVGGRQEQVVVQYVQQLPSEEEVKPEQQEIQYQIQQPAVAEEAQPVEQQPAQEMQPQEVQEQLTTETPVEAEEELGNTVEAEDEEEEEEEDDDEKDLDEDEDEEELVKEEPVSPLKRKRQQLEGPTVKKQKVFDPDFEEEEVSPVKRARGRQAGRSPRRH